MKEFVRMHREFWGTMPKGLKAVWKIAITISLGIQVSPFVYAWTH